MNIYEKLNIKKYINAHDTYTVYGGSRIDSDIIDAMTQISKHFVNIHDLQRNLGKRIANMSKNEAAYITNGAAGALQLCAAVCLASGNIANYYKLPDTNGVKSEIIMLKCQRNAYDKSVLTTGAKIIEVGDADETFDWDIINRINDNTAAIFYFPSDNYKRASLPLEQVIKVAHDKGIPVVVDAAAQLPPVENLWNYTQMGADMVIFSGGKTLSGPQDSGIIVGKAKYIDDCIRFGAPAHGICRSSKASRESMVGLYVAIEKYLRLDQCANKQRLHKILDEFESKLSDIDILKFTRINKGPVGQDYPRLFCRINDRITASEIAERMEKMDIGIYVGVEEDTNSIYISPLNLNNEEVSIVIESLKECLAV